MDKTVLILANFSKGLYLFRKELLVEMRKRGWKVIISVPPDPLNQYFVQLGCQVISSELDRKGQNPFKELKLLFSYWKLMQKYSPDCVLAYTIKPIVYGGMIASWSGKAFFPNITGLIAEAFAPGLKGFFFRNLYKLGIRNAQCVFFQNSDNQNLLLQKGICQGRHLLLPGSGVNLVEHAFQPYPSDGEIKILFLGRITKEKGLRELLAAITALADCQHRIKFQIAGMIDEIELGEQIKDFHRHNLLCYHGVLAPSEVGKHIEECHALILPSYHEGMSNVLLEAAATGRPLLTTDIPGCREAVRHGVTGFLFAPKSPSACEQAIRNFITLSYEDRKKMGLSARKKIEQEFDRNIVINHYFREIEQPNSAR